MGRLAVRAVTVVALASIATGIAALLTRPDEATAHSAASAASQSG
ncbi:hypothetical protein [Natrinema versiforme]|nr:hypothetical protein [Natrinema versiforme]